MPYNASITNTAPQAISSGNAQAWQALLYMLSKGKYAVGEQPTPEQSQFQAKAWEKQAGPSPVVDPYNIYNQPSPNSFAYQSMDTTPVGGYHPEVYGQLGAQTSNSY